MKLEKRFVVGSLMAIPFIPLIVLGFAGFWLYLYASSGWAIGQLLYDWIKDKVDA